MLEIVLQMNEPKYNSLIRRISQPKFQTETDKFNNPLLQYFVAKIHNKAWKQCSRHTVWRNSDS